MVESQKHYAKQKKSDTKYTLTSDSEVILPHPRENFRRLLNVRAWILKANLEQRYIFGSH
jgi:hypothetical protein